MKKWTLNYIAEEDGKEIELQAWWKVIEADTPDGAAEIGKACIKESIIAQWEKAYDEEEDGGRNEFLKELNTEISRRLSRRFIVRAVKLNAYGVPEVNYN